MSTALGEQGDGETRAPCMDGMLQAPPTPTLHHHKDHSCPLQLSRELARPPQGYAVRVDRLEPNFPGAIRMQTWSVLSVLVQSCANR